MDEGEGGDKMNQFHRNEAISAVSDDGFLGEEDEDYEDLYNDVNVSEGFLQALKKNEDLGNGGKRSDNNVSAKIGGVVASDSMPGVVSDAGVAGDLGASYENQGFRGSDGGKAPGGVGTGGLRVELGNSSNKMMIEQTGNDNSNLAGAGGIGQQLHVGSVGNAGNEALLRQGAGGNGNGNGFNAAGVGMVSNGGGSGVVVTAGAGTGGGGTTLFVGDLHWWTTDAQLEAECCKYGPVKEVKFFEEKASGKSKGYCQVDFYDAGAAAACKEGMHGYLFNGRPCVVAFASPHSIRRMGDAQANRSQQMGGQAKKGPNEAPSKPTGSSIPTGGNFQGGDNRGYGRGNWGRGNGQGMGNRGGAGGMRNRGGGMGGRGIMGNGGNGFGGAPPMMHPGSMMGQGFDPAFGGPMGRMGNYGGFPGGPAPPFSGMMPSYPPMGGVGMPGAAPHVNPAFFGRGMPMGGMGMMPGVDGPNMGMWPDPSMGGWGGDELGGGRAAESSYGEETASDQQLGDANPDRGGWQKEKDKAFERDWSGSSERRYRDDREPGHERSMPRERDGHDHDVSDKRHRDDRGDSGRERDRERDRDTGRSRDRDRGHSRDRERDYDRERDRERYSDHHRHKDRKSEHDDEWDGGRSSRAYGKSRLSQEDHRSRSRDGDYEKRRRLTSE